MNVNAVLPSITKTQYGRWKCIKKSKLYISFQFMKNDPGWTLSSHLCNNADEKKLQTWWIKIRSDKKMIRMFRFPVISPVPTETSRWQCCQTNALSSRSFRPPIQIQSTLILRDDFDVLTVNSQV